MYIKVICINIRVQNSLRYMLIPKGIYKMEQIIIPSCVCITACVSVQVAGFHFPFSAKSGVESGI